MLTVMNFSGKIRDKKYINFDLWGWHNLQHMASCKYNKTTAYISKSHSCFNVITHRTTARIQGKKTI